MADNNVITEEIQIKATDHATPAMERAARAMEHVASQMTAIQGAAGGAAKSINHAGATSGFAAQQTGMLGSAFKSLKDHALGIAVSVTGLSLGLAGLASKAYGANVELAAVTKGVAQVNYAFQGWNKNLSSGERAKIAKEEAVAVVASLDKMETRLAIPMASLGEIYRTVGAKGFSKLHLDQEQVIALTEKAAEASKVFGVSGESAALSISMALQKGVIPKGIDPFKDKLREILAGTEKLKLTSGQTYALIKKGLTDLGPAADVFSDDLPSNLARLKNQFESTLRDTAAPLFKHIVVLVEGWKTKLAASGTTMKELADKWGAKLVTVFDNVAKAIGFVADHWKVLAAAWLAFKVPAGIASMAGMFSGMKGGMSGLAGALGGSGSIGGVGGLLGSLGAAVPALGLVATAAAGAAAALDAIQDTSMARGRKADELGGFFLHMSKVSKTIEMSRKHPGKIDADAAIADTLRRSKSGAAELEKQGMLSGGKLNMEKFNTAVSAMSDESKKTYFSGMAGYNEKMSSGQLGALAAEIFRKIYMPDAPGDAEGKGKGAHDNAVTKAPTFTGDIHITQDFKDQDPDRVWISFKNGMENLAGNKLGSNLTQAHE